MLSNNKRNILLMKVKGEEPGYIKIKIFFYIEFPFNQGRFIIISNYLKLNISNALASYKLYIYCHDLFSA